jgi:hypothetical protein
LRKTGNRLAPDFRSRKIPEAGRFRDRIELFLRTYDRKPASAGLPVAQDP